jgi:hypothetical protein
MNFKYRGICKYITRRGRPWLKTEFIAVSAYQGNIKAGSDLPGDIFAYYKRWTMYVKLSKRIKPNQVALGI